MTFNLIDRYAFTPGPERAWSIAVEGALRLNPETKVQALIWAAIQADADWRFIGDRDNWLIIRRVLMHESTRPDDFGLIYGAVAAGKSEPELRVIAEQLVRLG